jgi:RHS repeat-associated protein
MRNFSVVCWPLAVLALFALENVGACNYADAQSQLDSSGIPVATSTFPVEHGIVNLNNGALHLEIPIVNYSQRGDVQLPATLNYDSNIWQVNTDGPSGASEWSPNGSTPSGQSATGGWYVSYHPNNQSITPFQWGFITCSNQTDSATGIDSGISWMDQSGTTHIFPATIITSTCTGVDGNSYVANTTASAYATDGSGYYAVVSDYAISLYPAVNIYDRSGTLVASNNLNVPKLYPQYPVSQPNYYSLSSFGGIGLSNGPILPVDRNGNSPVYSGSTILDTMNRNLINDTGIETVAGVGTVEYINVPVAGGHTATYTINYETIQVSTSFGYTGVSDVSDVSMLVVSSVDLPDGSSYKFGYDQGYGELNSMTLPHGGQVTYAYEPAPSISGNPPTRWVQQHVGSDGSTIFDWSQASTSSYSQAGTTCGLITNKVTTASAQNTYKFSSCNGNILLQEVDHGSATSSKIDAIDLYSYDTTHPCPTMGASTVYHIGCTGLQWLNITGKTTVLPANGSGTSLVTDTQYSYANPGTGIPTTVKQWDYYSGAPTSLPDSPPGLPTREVDTTLGYNVNGALFPTAVNVKNSAGTVVSSTTYTYDQSNYMSSTPSTAPNHSDALVTGNRGNLTTVARCCGWNGSSNVTLMNHVAYDDAGTVLAMQDANNNTTTLSAHDSTDTFPTTITLPSTVSAGGAAVSHVIYRTYDPNSGQVASATDQNGQTTTYTFDEDGRPYQVLFSNGGSPVTLQTTTYPSANETDVSVLQSNGVLLSAASIVDSYGRPSQSIQGGISTVTQYDAQGRLYSVTNPHGNTPSATDGTTVYSHDELGRVSSVTLPNGYPTTFTYAQNTVTVTDPLQHSREMVSDAFGNTTSVYEPNSTGVLNVATNYQYNWQNQLVQVIQKGGSTDSTQWRQRTFTFDGVGRLVSQTTPEAGTTLLGYDNNGNLTSTQNQNTTNNTNQYSYDALNRIITATIGGGPSYTYTYDAQDSSGDHFGQGLMTSTSNGSNVQTLWQHDPLGRIVSSTYCLPSNCSPGYNVQSSFDFQGNQTSLTYPDSRQIQWSYDQLNRPINETFAQWGSTAVGTPYVSDLSYTPGGMLQQATLGNGVQFGATYDPDANLSSLVYVANGAPIVEKTYTWDKNASNLTNIADLAPGRTQSYQYDQLDRLFSFSDSGTTATACDVNLPAIPSASQNYTIDAWGNMTSSGTDAFSQPIGANNQISSLQYDSAGNLLQDGVNTYQYRADGLMTGSDSTTYTYDALGQRVRKDGSYSNEYIYFGGQLLAMRNPSTGVWTDRIYGPTGALATVATASGAQQSGAPVYRATDHLGSLSYTLDASGNIIGTSAVLPYGQTTINTAGATFVFTDHERDSENQTDNTQYRHYASFQGRWLSPDPSNASYNPLDPQSLNRYSYVANRPMNKVDRLGLDGDTLTFTGGDDDDDDDDDSGGLSYSGGGSGGGGGNGFLTDLEDFFSEFSNFFGGGPAPPPPPGGIPSLASAGLPGSTQPNNGQQTINATLYYNGSTGVASSAWYTIDFSPGLDTDGMSTIPNSMTAPSKPPVDPNLPNCLTVGVKQLGQDLENIASPVIDTASTIKELAQGGFSALSDYFGNSASIYSATRINTAGTIGLLVPLRSSTYRGLLANSEALSAAAEATPYAFADVSLGQGIYNELENPTDCNVF